MALAEADEAFERLSTGSPATPLILSPPPSPADIAADESEIGAIGDRLRETAAALAARRIASAASGHPFGDLVAAAARAAAKGVSLGEAVEQETLHPTSPLREQPSQPIGAMRRATSNDQVSLLALPAPPSNNAPSSWVPF